ncbi:MAG: hypothetical protein HQL16_06045 [Candidatus Omnitrophica bacterium]|nr:hypothetical protein [Candidatus Omnitrophota bacterium]
MKPAFSFFLAAIMIFSATVSFAQENLFKKDNPDIDKYNFAKSYIMALSYYSRVAERLKLEDKDSLNSKSDIKAVRELVDHRTLDNTELRIAKNYLTKYENSSNAFIRKVSSETIIVYEKLLQMSVRERTLWQSFYVYKASGKPEDFNEADFTSRHIALAMEKKEVAKELVTQTAFVAKILLSAQKCDNETCKNLALTKDERDRLVERLDAFANGYMEWGMKPGQSTLEASIAILREVLEDSIYLSRT